MDKSQKFHKSMNPGNVTGVVDYWYTSTDFYNQKKYKDSFVNLLKYIDSTISIPNETSDSFEVTVKHGSVAITIKVDKDKFSIKAPFLKNVEGGAGLRANALKIRLVQIV